ncbi:hypothetical protein R0G64_32540, partial [Pseudomonas otitidis]
IRWSADVFAELESQPAKRQRMMRSLTPGVAPFSGSVQLPLQGLHPQRGGGGPQATAGEVDFQQVALIGLG